MNRRDAVRLLGANVVGLTIQRGAARTITPIMPSAEMMTRPIPSSGERLPVIGLGTWQTFDVGTGRSDRAPLEAVLGEFVALGGKVVDSSPMYGRSETVLGDLMAGARVRSKLFVATKVWTSGRAEGIAQMEASMRALRVSAVDLMQVHNLVDVDRQLDTLERWKREGRVRYIGVTHYTESAYDAVARVISSRKVDAVQINYSVGEREAERRLLPMARERGIAVIVNRPFAGGEVFARLRGRPLPDWAREIDCETWAQVLLKFVVSHPVVTCAIPATSNVGHLRDNMRAGMGRMPDEQMRARIAARAL